MKRRLPLRLDGRRVRWTIILLGLPVGFLGGVLWDITPVLYFLVIAAVGVAAVVAVLERWARD